MAESQSLEPAKTHKFNSLSSEKKGFFPFWEDVWRYRKFYTWGFVTLVLVDMINVVQPLLIKEAIDAILPKNLSRVWTCAFLALALLWLQAIGRYWWRIFLLGTSHRIAADIRTRFFNHLVKLAPDTYSKNRTGDLMSRATNDLESVRLALGPGVLVALDAAVLFVLIVPMMFSMSWKMSLLSLAFYPIVPWLTAKFGKHIDEKADIVQSRLSALSANAQESFAGIRLIKALGLEPAVSRRFAALSGNYTDAGIRLAKVEAGFSPLLSLITNLGTFLILLVGGMDVMTGAITVGTFVAFQRFVVQLSWPMEAIGWSVTIGREAKAAERRIRNILDEAELPEVLTGKHLGWKSDALLEIKELDVAYSGENGSGFQLHLQDLVIPPRFKVGLVGGVGAGKSMLFDFLTRLKEPPAGSIAWQGNDLRSIGLTALRADVAIVEQQITLFGETVRANIGMGLPNLPSPALVEKALRACQLTGEIAKLPEGMETILGERGVNLSGGQKQRLALARALVRQPKLLILDDCFSAVDVTNEQEIIEALFREFPDMAVLCASHRLSVMRKMDEIWLLERGRINARGTHSALLSSNSLYQELNEKSTRLEKLERWEGAVPPEKELPV